ncbi:hypothetical protein ACFL13_00155 [Patescibacteria group bacterium]
MDFKWVYYVSDREDHWGVLVLEEHVEKLTVPEGWRISSEEEYREMQLCPTFFNSPGFEELGFKIRD